MSYFSEYNYNDTLCHYGVKGMKWGVRKQRLAAKAKRNSLHAKYEANDLKKNKSWTEAQNDPELVDLAKSEGSLVKERKEYSKYKKQQISKLLASEKAWDKAANDILKSQSYKEGKEIYKKVSSEHWPSGAYTYRKRYEKEVNVWKSKNTKGFVGTKKEKLPAGYKKDGPPEHWYPMGTVDAPQKKQKNQKIIY